MRHRGPDHQGYRRFRDGEGRNAYLLSARLDIIDLAERSNQPLAAGATTLSYNGELYNYLEVREELRNAGRAFRTESDTEVLAAALDEWGVDALERCEGMWAFAAWNERDESLTLSRDRFGEKPLYLHHDETGLYWGSEVKLVAELAGRRFEPDLDHLFRYLVNGYKALYKQEGRTFFREVEELPRASALRV